jgi:signal recognition particle receptor subunit beta
VPKSQSAPRVAALIGPYMSGKTTLLESLLFASEAIPRKGTIKEGNTVGDAAPEARGRQMSVEISVASATYLGESWTFIDCPGSVEFAQETMNALMVADAAVLVVEADPGRAQMALPILKFLDDHNIPHTIFLNKVDNLTETGKIRETITALQSMSQRPLVLREYPIHAGSFITGYEDLSLERAFKANPGHPSEQIEIPESIKEEALTARQEMLEAISSLDDALMEKLLEEQVPSRDEVFATLTKGFRTDQIVPGAAGFRGQGPGGPPPAQAAPPRGPRGQGHRRAPGHPHRRHRAPGPGVEDRQRPAHRQAVPGAHLARGTHRGHDPQRHPSQLPHPPLRRQAGQGHQGRPGRDRGPGPHGHHQDRRRAHERQQADPAALARDPCSP